MKVWEYAHQEHQHDRNKEVHRGVVLPVTSVQQRGAAPTQGMRNQQALMNARRPRGA